MKQKRAYEEIVLQIVKEAPSSIRVGVLARRSLDQYMNFYSDPRSPWEYKT